MEWRFRKDAVMEKDGVASFNWILDGSELERSLLLRSYELGGMPYYEVAYFLTDRFIVKSLIEDPRERRHAWRGIRREGHYTYISWCGHSQDGFENYCQENRLPVPDNHRACWDRAVVVRTEYWSSLST